MPSVAESTEQAIAAATHLTDMDAGAVETLRVVAVMIDDLAETGGVREDGKLDNVSVPTYLKFCESLGLTPAGRLRLEPKREEPGDSTLAKLRAKRTG